MTPSAEVALLHAQLESAGTPARAAAEQRYLRSDLRHLGTSVPATRSVVRAWLRAHRDLGRDDLFAVIDGLWALPVHECRTAGIELLQQRPALVTTGDLPWIEARLRECRTWALVDPLAGWVTADLVARHPDATMPWLDRWVADADFWVRRAAVLSLRTCLHRDEQLDRFFAYADLLLPEREFFIRKVLGWVLREVAVRHPDEVSRWLEAHMADMNLVTLREPLRKLPDAAALRQRYDTRRNSPG